MSDRYARIAGSRVGGLLAGPLGLPKPARLDRHRAGEPLIDDAVLLGAAPSGRLAADVAEVLADAGAKATTTREKPLREAVAAAGLDAALFDPDSAGPERFKGLVFDASGIADSTELVELQRFFHPAVGRLQRSGRVLVLGTPPAEAGSIRASTAQRALEGFTRSLGKEVGRRGATVQLVLVSPGAEDQLASTLRFLLSPRSAYVSGQVVRIGVGVAPTPEVDWERPLQGKVALVTGASRGIGAAIAATLGRDGAKVVGLDVPQAADELRRVTGEVGGEALGLDITAADAPSRIAERFADGVDVVVHNAGVTRDRTIAKMPAERWSELMEINLSSAERINDALIDGHLLAANGRIVCVSSMSGIAGNAGQTNYAASKAGVIGMVQALAPELARRGATINAVAPGFIETKMTAAMPIGSREAGRRLNSLSQGGLPLDVAETIAWFASPASTGVNGNVVRVCGQSLLGA
jgi:3-oxoacyl-[acyl-carrier protein] reductase